MTGGNPRLVTYIVVFVSLQSPPVILGLSGHDWLECREEAPMLCCIILHIVQYIEGVLAGLIASAFVQMHS